MITRNQIRQFLALVDAGNFTLASRRINVSQPTLSMGIAELEKRLDTQLFVRERKRIQLTEAGNRLLPFARSIEREFGLAESSVTGLQAPQRPIRLGILHSLSTEQTTNALALYEGEEALEIVEGTVSELSRMVANGELDLAISLLEPRNKSVETHALFTEPYCVALDSAHPLARQAVLNASQLANATMVARRTCELLARTSRFFTERGVRPPFILRTNSEERAMAIVRAGRGVTVAPTSLGTPGVTMIPMEGFDFTRTVALLFSADWKAHYGHDHALPATLIRELSSDEAG